MCACVCVCVGGGGWGDQLNKKNDVYVRENRFSGTGVNREGNICTHILR